MSLPDKKPDTPDDLAQTVFRYVEEVYGKPIPEAQRTSENFKIYAALIELAERDPVTGGYNATAFKHRAEKAISRTKRGQHAVIALIDINDFKKYNKSYTHAGGNAVLKHVNNVIQSAVRNVDFVARWGGDEFAVIFWDVEENEAKTFLKRIKEKIRETPCVYEEKQIPIDVAFSYQKVQGTDTVESITKTISNGTLTQQALTKEVQGRWTFDEVNRDSTPGRSESR